MTTNNGYTNGNNNFIKEDPWRIFRIMAGLVYAPHALTPEERPLVQAAAR